MYERSLRYERTFVRRQFMRGTDPIKSRWECLRIVMLVARYVFEFFSSLIPYWGIKPGSIINLLGGILQLLIFCLSLLAQDGIIKK